jgi:hypothetical protein
VVVTAGALEPGKAGGRLAAVDEAVELAADVAGQAVAVERRCGEEVVEVLAKDVLENPRSGASEWSSRNGSLRSPRAEGS